MAKGKFDAYLLMPRGARDEEFHNAITDLLSDWGSTVPDPEVVSVKIVSPTRDPLTMAIRDFLGRMACRAGSASRTPRPAATSSSGTTASRTFPLVYALDRPPIVARSVRDVATNIYGAPDGHRPQGGRRPRAWSARVRPVSPPRSTRASEGLSTVVLEAEAVGGQAGTSSMIRNYLGFPRGISGMRLAQRARNQALRFGTRFYTGQVVDGSRPGADGDPHVLCTESGDVRARAVVIATGVAYRKLARRADRGAGRAWASSTAPR